MLDLLTLLDEVALRRFYKGIVPLDLGASFSWARISGVSFLGNPRCATCEIISTSIWLWLILVRIYMIIVEIMNIFNWLDSSVAEVSFTEDPGKGAL